MLPKVFGTEKAFLTNTDNPATLQLNQMVYKSFNFFHNGMTFHNFEYSEHKMSNFHPNLFINIFAKTPLRIIFLMHNFDLGIIP